MKHSFSANWLDAILARSRETTLRKDSEYLDEPTKIKATIYSVMALHDKKTRAFLKETYSEASFYFTLQNAPVGAEPEDLVTDQMIDAQLRAYPKT